MKHLAALLALTSLSGCSPYGSNYSVPDPVTISGNTIEVRPDSKFLAQVQVVAVTSAPGGERVLRTVGQMIALANPSGGLLKEEISWVTLDPEMPRALGIPLGEKAPNGLAYGVTAIPVSYRNEIHSGEHVELYRYGLRQNSTGGTVVSVRQATGGTGEDSVIFAISHGQDWYPGTNCQVEFPLVHRRAVALSPLSMLHEGRREYVLKETGANHFTPEEITVVNETKEQVYALGALSPGDRVIERGAILIKPLVHEILTQEKEAEHVR